MTKLRWWHAAVALILVLGLAFALRVGRSRPPAAAEHPGLEVPEGQAGKAGDLQVTQEALELAEIHLGSPIVRDVPEKLAVSGLIRTGGDRQARVSPPAQGKVIGLRVLVGARVRPGQVLAVLESADLAAAQAEYRQAAARVAALEANLARQRQLADLGQFSQPAVEESRERTVRAESQLFEAQSGQAQAESSLAQARTELQIAERKMRRAEAVPELVSAQERERNRADYNNSIARLKAAEAAVTAARNEVALTKKSATIASGALAREERIQSGGYRTSRELVEAESELRLAAVERDGAADKVALLGGELGGGSTISVRSPIAGVVQDTNLTLGQLVDPEDVAFTVINLDRVWAELAVAPRDLAKVRQGDPVVLRAESSQRTFKGRVESISPAADETTRSVMLRAELTNPDASLKSGAFVRGDLITDVRVKKLTVPDAALQDHAGRPTLYVELERPGSFEVRHVLLGARGEGWQEVTDGLKSGEKLAVSGTFYLKSEALKSALADGCCGAD